MRGSAPVIAKNPLYAVSLRQFRIEFSMRQENSIAATTSGGLGQQKIIAKMMSDPVLEQMICQQKPAHG
jgi:hypothetical protein